jgi:hypothetical protein
MYQGKPVIQRGRFELQYQTALQGLPGAGWNGSRGVMAVTACRPL